MAEPTIPSPVEAPPPAYEFAQHDFDQKLAIATDRSLRISNPQCEDGQDGTAEEQREGSNETANTNGTRRAEPQADGQLASVRPLNFRKKARSSNSAGEASAAKERPSWFEEAQLGASASGSRRPLPAPGGQQSRSDRSFQHTLPEVLEDDSSLPPPPFMPIDNSLDGPAYVRNPRNDPRRRRTGASNNVLRYNNEDLAASPPPSPPNSPLININSSAPSMSARQRAASPNFGPGGNAYHHTPQPQLRLQVKASTPHPTSPASKMPHYVPPPPRVNFDPSIAYEGTRSSLFGKLPADTREKGPDPAALYSSAVAPLMSSQKTLPSKTHVSSAPKVKRYASSISSLPEYDQQQLQQSAQPLKSPYGMQDYAASRASFYSTSSTNSAPQYPHVAQYPQMAQYPTQQSYARPQSVMSQSDNQLWPSAGAQYQTQYYQR